MHGILSVYVKGGNDVFLQNNVHRHVAKYCANGLEYKMSAAIDLIFVNLEL